MNKLLLSDSEQLMKLSKEHFLEEFEYKVIQPNINHIYFQPNPKKRPVFSVGKIKRATRNKKKRVQNRTIENLMDIISFRLQQDESKHTYTVTYRIPIPQLREIQREPIQSI